MQHVIDADFNASTLTLLDASIHDLDKFRAQTLNCKASTPQIDERRLLACENCILTTIDPVHEIVDCCRAQTYQSWVILMLFWQRSDPILLIIEREANVIDFIVLFAHELHKFVLNGHILRICVFIATLAYLPSALWRPQVVVKFVVEVWFVFDWLDTAVSYFNETLILIHSRLIYCNNFIRLDYHHRLVALYLFFLH